MRLTFNPLSGQFDAYELDVSPPGDVEFLKGDGGISVGPDAGNAISIVGGPGIDVTEDVGNNKLTVSLTGGIEATGQTVGAVSTDLIVFPAGATPGTARCPVFCEETSHRFFFRRTRCQKSPSNRDFSPRAPRAP